MYMCVKISTPIATVTMIGVTKNTYNAKQEQRKCITILNCVPTYVV